MIFRRESQEKNQTLVSQRSVEMRHLIDGEGIAGRPEIARSDQAGCVRVA